MRDSVVVEGVRLAREVVEKATEELNTPEPLKFKAGNVVRCSYLTGTLVVIGGGLEQIVAKEYGHSCGFLRVTDGERTWIVNPSQLTLVRERI